MATKGTKRICEKGHTYYKSSDCPVCPVCESEKKPQSGLLSKVGAPARRALVAAGITSETDLARYTLKELKSLHGIGPSALRVLEEFMKNSSNQFTA